MRDISRKCEDDTGFLSMVDASLLAVMILLVSFFFFHSLSAGLFYRSEPRRAAFERESVKDIQKSVLRSVIGETGYLKETDGESQRVTYTNITVDTAIKNYLYLKNRSEDEDAGYDLSELEENIKKQYERCAGGISHYHYAVDVEDGPAGLFISDHDEINDRTDLPDQRSAHSTYTTLGLERVQITLYIWR